MRFFRAFIPNLSLALNVALLVVIYLDRRNPMMGFLVGAPFLTLAVAACTCSIITAVIVYGDWRRQGRRAERNHPGKSEKVEIDS